MRVEISGRNVSIRNWLREFVDRRLSCALERFSRRIDLVQVTLSDVNGPRGGPDKQCRIVTKLRAGQTLVVNDRDMGLQAAVAKAADHMSQSVARAVDRRRSRRFLPSSGIARRIH